MLLLLLLFLLWYVSTGLSRTIKQHETHRTTNTCGTLSHTAPGGNIPGLAYLVMPLLRH
jgi:hypothetical protein